MLVGARGSALLSGQLHSQKTNTPTKPQPQKKHKTPKKKKIELDTSHRGQHAREKNDRVKEEWGRVSNKRDMVRERRTPRHLQ